MGHHFEDLSGFLSPVEVPAGLESRILKKITHQQKRSDYLNLGLFGLAHLASWFALVYSGYYLAGQLALSDFSYYLDLIYSDFSLIANYWSVWLLALAESLPVFGLIILSGTLSLTLWTMSKTLNNSQKILLAS
jgi:hypothetical protein